MQPSGAALQGRAAAPRRRAGRALPAWRHAFLGGTAIVALASAGCATKRDVRDVREQMAAMQARQDSLFRALAEQNRALMDSVRQANELMLRVRGELGNQLVALERQLIQIQELAGQSQQQLASLRQQVTSRQQQLAAPPAMEQPADEPAAGSGAGAEQLYRAGMEQLRRGNTSVARQAFAQLMRDHLTHELAPEAQLQLAETFYLERSYDRALQELERVPEVFPGTPAAPRALYRAGVIAEEQGNIPRARSYFQRVISGYPTSEESATAREKLRRLSDR
jgi:TolA-binding protein